MATINNPISIKNKINQALKASRYSNFAFNAASTRFVAAKRELLIEFDNEPVNQEIKDGPTADNISQSLEKGNLFSFIGFNENAKPVEELKEFIEENITISNKVTFEPKGNKFYYNFPVNYPSLEEINEFTSMNKYADNYPNSKGWVSLVRSGISGVGQYIYHQFFNSQWSRSGTGLQDKRRETGRTFNPVTDYLLNIFKQFKSKFTYR